MNLFYYYLMSVVHVDAGLGGLLRELHAVDAVPAIVGNFFNFDNFVKFP